MFNVIHIDKIGDENITIDELRVSEPLDNTMLSYIKGYVMGQTDIQKDIDITEGDIIMTIIKGINYSKERFDTINGITPLGEIIFNGLNIYFDEAVQNCRKENKKDHDDAFEHCWSIERRED